VVSKDLKVTKVSRAYKAKLVKLVSKGLEAQEEKMARKAPPDHKVFGEKPELKALAELMAHVASKAFKVWPVPLAKWA
jgi:hypothetical protein